LEYRIMAFVGAPFAPVEMAPFGAAPLISYDPLAGAVPPLGFAPHIAPMVAPFGFEPLAPTLGPGPGDAAIYEERQEYLSELWAFSRFALPWLVFTFLLLGVVLGMTFWQQTGDIKDRYDGVPRRLIRTSDKENEGGNNGQTLEVRNLRIAAFTILIVSSVFGFLLFFARPKPKIRSALGFLIAVLLIIGAILAWIAFGVALSHTDEARRCPAGYRTSRARCQQRDQLALGQIALDAAMGSFGILSAILLAINAHKGHWRMAPRDWTEEQRDRELEPVKERLPGEMIQKNVSFVRKWLVGLCLLVTLAVSIGALILLWIRETDRSTEYVGGTRGRTNFTDVNDDHGRLGPNQGIFEHGGWRTINTGLRLAGTVGGIIIIILNFMPFRSRAVVMVFGFLYFACAVVLFICFAFDVRDLNKASGYVCPTTLDGEQLDCENHRYVATVVLEFIAALALVIYVIVEYIIKRGRPKLGPETIEAAYGIFAFSKKEVRMPADTEVKAVPTTPTVECSSCAEEIMAADLAEHVHNCTARPVPCDACGETFRARDYNGHRAVCGEMLVSCNLCDDQLHRFRLQNHQESECPKRMVLCDQCGDAFQYFRLDRHRRAECPCRSE